MNLSQVNLNLLVALDALLAERSVTRAGHRVGLSQPAMSGTLARLRELFNDDLLVRIGRDLELTPLARELIEPVRQAVRQIESIIEHRSGFDPARETRSFTIAASDYVCSLLLPFVIERLSAEAPSISLKFMYLLPNPLNLLATEKVDFAIMPSEIARDLPGELLFVDDWVCAVWSGHPGVGETLTREQYVALPHVTLAISRSDNAGSIADDYLAEVALGRHVCVSTESFLLSLLALRGTRCVALVQRRLAERIKDAAEIKLLRPPLDLPDIHESIYWNRRNANSPSHLWLKSLFVEAAKKL